eukprot:6522491-Heterocapsa_arctica.AAC.1
MLLVGPGKGEASDLQLVTGRWLSAQRQRPTAAPWHWTTATPASVGSAQAMTGGCRTWIPTVHAPGHRRPPARGPGRAEAG